MFSRFTTACVCVCTCVQSVCIYMYMHIEHIRTYVHIRIQWNPFITDTIGNQHFVPYSEVSRLQLEPQKLSVIQSSRVSTIQGLLKY